MKKELTTTLVFLFVILVGTMAAAEVPHLMNYQGVLMTPEGDPLDGTYDLTFRIYPSEDSGSVPLWEEQLAGVNFDNGVFHVLLGNITPIPDSTWENGVCWMGLTVAGEDEISPRIRVAAVPYAMRAAIADNVQGGAGTGDGHSLDAADGSPTDAVYVDDQGEVGVGTTSPATLLNIQGSPVDARGQFSIGAPSAEDVFFSFYTGSVFAAYLWYDTSDNDLRLQNVTDFAGGDLSLNPYGGNVGIGTLDPSEALEVVGTIHSSSGGFRLPDGTVLATSGDVGGGDDDWLISGDNISASVTGNVGIGTPSPNSKLHVDGQVQVDRPDGYTVYLGHPEASVYGEAFDINNLAADIYGALAHDRYGLYAYCSNNCQALRVDGRSLFNGGATVWGHDGSSRAFYVDGSMTDHAAEFVGKVLIRSGDDYSPVIELGEGLDYAEGFDVSDIEMPAPGEVLAIDPANPGQLTRCTGPYDSKVAGIVAGAESLGSGVRLGVGRFDCDVALAGRVYCNVDASENAIEPGDLLTTSSIPGHAMKVADPLRAMGAVLGKAMEPLPKGSRGKILVLVTLQ